MKLNALICRAASVYPEAYVLEYWDSQAEQPRANPRGGDTLAQFIAQELADTFDPEADETQQIAQAVRVMQSATTDLENVSRALMSMSAERRYEHQA